MAKIANNKIFNQPSQHNIKYKLSDINNMSTLDIIPIIFHIKDNKFIQNIKIDNKK
jgi:hypothetical protein